MTTPAGGPEWWLGMYRDVRLKTWSYSNIWIYTLRLAKNWWAMIWTHHWDIDMNSHFKYFEVVWWNSASNNTHANDQTDQSCKISPSEALLLLRFADCALAHSHTHKHCHRDMAHSTLMSHEVFPKIGYDHDAKHLRTACPRPHRKELFFPLRKTSWNKIYISARTARMVFEVSAGRLIFFFQSKVQTNASILKPNSLNYDLSPLFTYCYTPSEINSNITQWTYIPSKNVWENVLPKVEVLVSFDRKPAAETKLTISVQIEVWNLREQHSHGHDLMSTFDGEVQPISGKMGLFCWCWLRKDLGQFKTKRGN